MFRYMREDTPIKKEAVRSRQRYSFLSDSFCLSELDWSLSRPEQLILCHGIAPGHVGRCSTPEKVQGCCVEERDSMHSN